jgi:hypothetical protein
MRVSFVLGTLSLFLAIDTAKAEVPQEIVSLCQERWGNDYEMQLFCQREQLKAYNQLNQEAPSSGSQFSGDATVHRAVKNGVAAFKKGGMSGLHVAISQCSKIADRKKTLDSTKYCFSLEMLAYSLDAAFYRANGLDVDSEVEKRKSKSVRDVFGRLESQGYDTSAATDYAMLWAKQSFASIPSTFD